MAADGRHSTQTANHLIENWTYANAGARTGATGFVSADVGKIAYQTDTGVYYRLTAITPTWLQITFPPSAFTALTYRTISGTTDSPAATDAGKTLRTTNGSAVTITFDPSLFAVGDVGTIRQIGAGQVTVAVSSGSIISAGTLVKTRLQYSEISWSLDAAGVLHLSGDLG